MSAVNTCRIAVSGVISLMVLGSAQVVAQPASEGESRGLPTIDVRGILPSEIRFAPGAASALSAEKISTLRPFTLHDAFDFIPGVRTIDDDVLGRRSGIGIRGAPSRRSRKVLLLEDGTPINASTYLDSSGHYTPPMERLEQVEVLRANGQILHGPLNNHGVINFVNRQATATPETTVEVGVGSLNTNKRHVLHTRTVDDVGLVFAYSGLNSDGAFDMEDSQFDDFYTSAQWQIDDRQSLGASLTHYRERSHYDESNLTPVEYALAPRRKLGRFGQEFNTLGVDYYKFDLVHDIQVSDRLKMATKVFYTNLDRARFTVEPEAVLVGALPDFVYEDPDTQFIAGQQGEMVSRDRHYRTMGIETRLELGAISMGGHSHTLQWGFRAERHELDDDRTVGAPGEVISFNNRGPKTRNDHYIAEAGSVFIQDVISFGDWMVTPGLRAEYFTQSRERRPVELSPGPHGPKETDHNDVWLPGISVLYTGFENSEVFASVQRGYSPAIARTAAGFPLVPETGVNSQLGFRSTLHPGVRLEGALFYNRLSNTIVQLPVTINDQNLVINSGDSDAMGADIALRINSSAFTGSQWNVYSELAWNYTRAEFDGGVLDGNRIPEVPVNSGSLSVGVEHASGWHVSATLSHAGDFYTDPLNTEDFILADEDLEIVGPGDYLEIREPVVLGRVPSHTLLSARASYTPQDMSGTTFWLQGRNLTDRLYITDLANGIRPGAERSFIVGVTVNF